MPILVLQLFTVTPIVGVCNCSMFCCTLLYVHSSIAIILMGKRELVALLNLSSWCLVMVERLFLAVPRGCLRFVIVVFPDHTHYFCVRAACEKRRNTRTRACTQPHRSHFCSRTQVKKSNIFKKKKKKKKKKSRAFIDSHVKGNLTFVLLPPNPQQLSI